MFHPPSFVNQLGGMKAAAVLSQVSEMVFCTTYAEPKREEANVFLLKIILQYCCYVLGKP